MENSTATRRRSWYRLLWILPGLIVVYVILPFVFTGYPPMWWVRHQKERELLERVQSAGGWAALKRDCDALAAKFKDDDYGFGWRYGDTNSLPRAIAALRPKEVLYYSPKLRKESGIELSKAFGTNDVVRIHVFGAHSTGGRSGPWLYLEVVGGNAIVTTDPEQLRSSMPQRTRNYRKISDYIYEYY